MRGRTPRKRKRRNLIKFIPEGDSDFAFVAECVFLDGLRPRPSAFGLTGEDVACIEEAVSAFRAALARCCRPLTRNAQAVYQKDAARAGAEEVVRRYANIIRANPDVSDADKRMLRLKVRPRRLGKRQCPKHPPRLQFLGSGDGQVGNVGTGSGSGIHVIRYCDGNDGVPVHASSEVGRVRRAKPDGAVRVELFFDLVPWGEAVGRHPAQRGWPKYLRSFTRSPMEVEFPIPSQPMLVVYWARWADSTGQVSRWSEPCVARIEGWSAAGPPALPQQSMASLRSEEARMTVVHTPIAGELPAAARSDTPAHTRIALLVES